MGWLDRRRASFETAAQRPPQDDGVFLMPSKPYRHPEERPKGRVSKDARPLCSPFVPILGQPHRASLSALLAGFREADVRPFLDRRAQIPGVAGEEHGDAVMVLSAGRG